MIIDLFHNRIVKETVTEAFEKSVRDNLIPKLHALYGDALEGVQMYEDYLCDNFTKDGYVYYPLTVLISGINTVLWIKWDVSDASSFKNGVPYAYVGEGLDFIVADDTPIAFKNAIEGRANYFEGGYVKTNVITDAPSYTILSGKYSQTFVDEMTRQITRVISKACGVDGLEDSSIEIDIAFAPNTYMEHTSENVTYRRLLISAKGCTARDFWIKWTRLNSSVAFSVNDNVSEGEIIFELGEDVSQKIREKEYRFLVYGNSEKYRVAMGRKNITEWRELIKRAVKRGELKKPMSDLEKSAHISEVSDKLSQILEKCGISIPTATETDIKVSADAANEALRIAVGVEESEDTIDMADEPIAQSVTEAADAVVEESYGEQEQSFDLGGLEISETEDGAEDEFAAEQDADGEDDFDFDKEHEQFEIEIPENGEPSPLDVLAGFMPAEEQITETEEESEAADDKEEITPDEDAFLAALVSAVREDEPEHTATVVSVPASEAEDEAEQISTRGSSLETAELELRVRVAESKQAQAEEQADAVRLELEGARNELIAMSARIDELAAALDAEKQNAVELRVEIEKQRFAAEQIKRLADEAELARELAEAETARIRAEHEELKRENANLVEFARAAEETCAAAEEKSRICEEKLEEQIELYEKEKLRQKNLFAEAARQAKEELDKNAVDEVDAGASLAAEEARLEAIRAEADRVKREADLEEQKAKIEAEAIRRMNERTQAQKTLEERALEARLAMEERARRLADERTASANASNHGDSEAVKEAEGADVSGELSAPVQAPEADDVQQAAIPETVSAPEQVSAPEVKYTYISKIVRILFKNTVDHNITSTIRDMMNEALKMYGFEKLYMEVKAGVVDNNTVVLNFVKYPMEERNLLVDIIKYIGNGGLGIYKIILE